VLWCSEADTSISARAFGLWQRIVNQQIYYYSKPGEPFLVLSDEHDP
jgi:hypothetical protein